MEKQYLCRVVTNNDTVCWEEVTDYVFENRKHALNDDGTKARYHENDYVVKNEDGRFDVSYSGPPDGLSQMVKFFAIKEYTPVSKNGFVNTPTHVSFCGKSKNQAGFLFDLKSGMKYKAVPNAR